MMIILSEFFFSLKQQINIYKLKWSREFGLHADFKDEEGGCNVVIMRC